jgi:hypothetical protein
MGTLTTLQELVELPGRVEALIDQGRIQLGVSLLTIAIEQTDFEAFGHTNLLALLKYLRGRIFAEQLNNVELAARDWSSALELAVALPQDGLNVAPAPHLDNGGVTFGTSTSPLTRFHSVADSRRSRRCGRAFPSLRFPDNDGPAEYRHRYFGPASNTN